MPNREPYASEVYERMMAILNNERKRLRKLDPSGPPRPTELALESLDKLFVSSKLAILASVHVEPIFADKE